MNDYTAGSAGASARREHERRTAKDEAKVREFWGQGRIGSVAVALTPERQTTGAWRGGSGGEAVVGAALDRISGPSIRVLHDQVQRAGRSRANIDHLVVTPRGIWVIDTKRYVQQRPTRTVEGGLFSPRVERFTVGRRDGTKLIEGVLGQVEKVREVVGDDLRIQPVLCFVDADWPVFGGDLQVCGVLVNWPKRLVSQIRETAGGAVDVEAVAARLRSGFRDA